MPGMRVSSNHVVLEMYGSERLRQVAREAVGRNLWEAFPDWKPVLGDLYNRAWTAGAANRVVYHNSQLVDVHISRVGDVLVVHWESLTLEGLRQAVAEAERWVGRPRGRLSLVVSALFA